MSTVSNYKSKNVAAISATILNGQTKSSIIDLQGTSLAGFWTPAALTGTSFTIENEDPTNPGIFLEVRDSSGAAITITVAASGFYTLTPGVIYSLRKIKIVSNAAEGADRVIVVKPYPIS